MNYLGSSYLKNFPSRRGEHNFKVFPLKKNCKHLNADYKENLSLTWEHTALPENLAVPVIDDNLATEVLSFNSILYRSLPSVFHV